MPSFKSAFVFCSLGMLFLLNGCQEKPQVSVGLVPVEVETVTVRAADEPHWIELLGKVEGMEEVEVRPQVGGILKKILYREGDPVKEGDVLFEIDDAPYRARLEAARAATKRAEVDLAQAERELRRSERLFKAKAVSEKDRDEARDTRNQALHDLKEAQASERDSEISLEWTRVEAPASGLASRAEVNPGALLTASTSLLATITQHGRVRVMFSPSERDLGAAAITTENPVRVLRTDGSETSAAIDYIAQSIDPTLGTRLIRANLPEDTTVLPGEFVRVRLMVAVDRQVFRVPQKSVLQLPDGTYVVYVRSGDKAERRSVEVGLWEGRDWVIRSGLRDGDEVITNQLIRLRDGYPLKPKS